MINSIKSFIWQFITALGEARYAAHLARQGKAKEAQDFYNKV